MVERIKISKAAIDKIELTGKEFTLWDKDIRGFGIRVRANGGMAYVYTYRAGHGRKAPQRKLTIGETSKLTPDEARAIAKKHQGSVAHGKDPAREKSENRTALTVTELAGLFLAEHVEAKRKGSTAKAYEAIFRLHILPELGSTKAISLTRAAVIKLHLKMKGKRAVANKMLRVMGSMYSFAQLRGFVPEGFNPATKTEKYREDPVERFLTDDELARLGDALVEAETTGLPWEDVDTTQKNAKHLAKPANRKRKFDPAVVAAVRLLVLTGCRLREILNLKWEHVNKGRGLIFLPDSKTGRKTVVLNPYARDILGGLQPRGDYVVPGEDLTRPRPDLKRIWAALKRRANLNGVRIHDLRHTFASIGAGDGLGLPMIGKLLGHTQASTTQRYAHVDIDPAHRASTHIGSKINAAMNRNQPKNEESAL